jgi:CDP-glucose 4,6-dehydratase
MQTQIGSVLKSLPGPVLITGHTGFKGAWLLLLLTELGIETAGYSLPPEPDSLHNRISDSLRVRETFGDICDKKNFDEFVKAIKPAYIFHLAAQPLVLKSYEIPLETFSTNVLGTANVLNAALKTKSVQGVSVITTDKVYRNLGHGDRFIESDALQGSDPYSASKVGTEAAVAAWQQVSRLNDGPSIISLRAGNVIGGGDFAQNRLIPDLIRGAIEGKNTEIRNPESTRPWQHVLDPLMGYLKAAEYSILSKQFESFNFGPLENSLPVREVVAICGEEWNQIKTDVQTISHNNQESEFLNLDSTKAMEVLGWRPHQTQESAIRSTVNWWKRLLTEHKDPHKLCLDEINEYLLV